MTHALYDLLRGFRTARFERSGLSATARRAAAIGTTTGESSWRAVVRTASGGIPSILRPRSIPVSCSDPVPYPVWNFIAPSPAYVFVGSASPSHPQLVFKDGTTYTVTDYWRVNDKLHFITIEEGGTKSVPHAVPFGDLDVQRTTDANAAQGFRFVLRDEPIEQWLEHHAHDAPRRHRNNGVG